MAKSSAHTRFSLSEDQKTVLERFYKDGMQSKGKTCSSLHLQAQEATNLPLDVIQNWIGNYKRGERKGAHKMDNMAVMTTLESEGLRPPKKGRLLSTPNAYNVHVAEFLKSEDALALTTTKEKYCGAAEKWRAMSEAEKSQCKERIGEYSRSKSVTWSKIQKVMRKMHSEAQLLSDAAGVETVTLHFHKGSVFTSGSERGLQFLQDHAVVKLSFTSYFYEKSAEEEMPEYTQRATSSLKNLVEQVEMIFQQKYAISTSLVENVPYDAKDVIISLKNLPKNISFKRPSLYGVRQLQMIIAQKSKFEMHVQRPSLTQSDHNYCMPSSTQDGEAQDQEDLN